jgi:CRP-like cAMP-binding protein
MNALPEIRGFPFGGMPSANTNAANENLLSYKEQLLLQRVAAFLAFKRSAPLYSQGEKGRFVYLIAEGVVRINRCDETGSRQILEFRGNGDICGVPHRGCYFNSAEAASQVSAYRLEWCQIQDMILSEPHLQLVLLGKISHDYRQAQIRISTLGHQNTCQRVATFLLELAGMPPFFESETSCVTLPISRFDLADYLGMTPESTARAFNKLESHHLVRRITARKIKILDRNGLRMIQDSPRQPETAGQPE